MPASATRALDVGRHHRQSVLEMGLPARLAMFVRAFVPSMVAVTGEPPGHGVQGEAGIEFLFHSPLAWPMEVFHLHPLLGHLVPFFHAPSCAIPLRQLRDGVLLRIQQGGSEDEDRFADEVFHQPKAVCTTGGECAFAGGDLHHHILSIAGDEMVDVGTGFPLYPEHRMQSPDHVHVQHP